GDGVQANQQMGATALAGLALLECDVPADDPAVRNAARAVRAASVSSTNTYSLSLGIMFLDRLGGAGDAELIESTAVRLPGGQRAGRGGWGVRGPAPGGGGGAALAGGERPGGGAGRPAGGEGPALGPRPAEGDPAAAPGDRQPAEGGGGDPRRPGGHRQLE